MILGLGNERYIHSPWFKPWDKGMAQIILPHSRPKIEFDINQPLSNSNNISSIYSAFLNHLLLLHLSEL
ncbi:hypothetical protein ACFCT7_13620 [Fulvivirgaceae bacterium LMO-SS25]